MTHRRTTVPALALTLALVGSLALGACDDDDGGGDAAGRTTTTSAAAPRSTTTAPPDGEPTTTAAPATQPGGCAVAGDPGFGVAEAKPAGPGTLTDLVVGTSDDGCVDRVEFVFRDAVPGYRVEYQPGPFTRDASGEPVAVAGSAFLVVRFEPAYTYDLEAAEEVYTGPRDLTPEGTRHVRQVVNTGDFEAVVTWVIGLSERAPVAVTAEGTRLVVSIG